MLRPSNAPAYRLHKPSGLAVARFECRVLYFCKHGTPESITEYNRVLAELLANGRRLPNLVVDISINCGSA
jgi:hypothetical protein